MKVSIIGGGGLVGSCTAYALQCGGLVSGIDLIDVNADLCRGQALDLLHGSALTSDQRIRATGYESDPRARPDLHHRRSPPQAGREPARPDQSKRRAVPRRSWRTSARRGLAATR